MKKYLIITAMFAIFFGFAAANTSKAANSPFASLLKKPISGTISKTIKPISGTIKGMIKDKNGKPFNNAVINLYKKVDNKFEYYATTKSNLGPKGGRYEFKVTQKGVYRIIPAYGDSSPKQETVKVINNKPVFADFRLRVAQ